MKRYKIKYTKKHISSSRIKYFNHFISLLGVDRDEAIRLTNNRLKYLTEFNGVGIGVNLKDARDRFKRITRISPSNTSFTIDHFKPSRVESDTDASNWYKELGKYKGD